MQKEICRQKEEFVNGKKKLKKKMWNPGFQVANDKEKNYQNTFGGSKELVHTILHK